jgi:nicotinamidase-related amidase
VEAGVTIDPQTTAVVLIEYQNDFVSEGGALHGAVEEVMDKTNIWTTPSGSSRRPEPPE